MTKRKAARNKKEEFWDLPKCGKFMSCYCVKNIQSILYLCNDPTPNYHDYTWVIFLIASFNDHMK